MRKLIKAKLQSYFLKCALINANLVWIKIYLRYRITMDITFCTFDWKVFKKDLKGVFSLGI